MDGRMWFWVRMPPLDLPELGPSAAGMAMLLRGRGDGSFEPMPLTHSGLNASETRSLARIEMGDGPAQGLLFGINRRAPQAYQPKAQGHWLSITLKGKTGNVEFGGQSRHRRTCQRTATNFRNPCNCGFATQSSHRIVVGLGTSPPIRSMQRSAGPPEKSCIRSIPL